MLCPLARGCWRCSSGLCLADQGVEPGDERLVPFGFGDPATLLGVLG